MGGSSRDTSAVAANRELRRHVLLCVDAQAPLHCHTWQDAARLGVDCTHVWAAANHLNTASLMNSGTPCSCAFLFVM